MIRSKHYRGGSILICVLTCLLIVSGLAIAMVKSALNSRKAVRSELQQAQAQFLLEAGVQRAVHKLTSDSTYDGETWELPPAVFNNSAPARVDIAVTTNDDSSPTVSVIAQLPADSPLSVRRSYTFAFSTEE